MPLMVTTWRAGGIVHLGLGVPVLCLIAGSFFVLRFPLNRRRHAAIRLRLERRDRSTAALQQRPPYLEP